MEKLLIGEIPLTLTDLEHFCKEWIKITTSGCANLPQTLSAVFQPKGALTKY